MHRITRRSLVLPLLAAALLFGGFGCRGSVSGDVREAIQPFTLRYWSVFTDESAIRPAVQRFQAMHPNIRIDYRRFTVEEYERELLNALAEDRGPDIMSIHHTWMSRWQPRLLPVPATLNVVYLETSGGLRQETTPVIRQVPGMTVRRLATEYLPVVSQDAVLMTEQADPRAPLVPRVYGLPLSVDTMVLYYNRDMLNESGIAAPPQDWKTFQEQVVSITRLDEVGNIIRSAAAMGTADNVERPTDVLATLMLQNGAPMTDANGMVAFDRFPPELAGRQYPPGAEALIFYTDFANPAKEVYTWNGRMPASLAAFTSGRTAFFFGYAYHLPAIRSAAPRMNLGITTFPQIAGNPPIYGANYWLETVSNKTARPNEAWEFVQFITAQQQAEAYVTATKRPTALNALIARQAQDFDLSTFAAQLPGARSWYRGEDVAAMEDAFKDMIRQALADEADPGRIVELGAIRVNQTIR